VSIEKFYTCDMCGFEAELCENVFYWIKATRISACGRGDFSPNFMVGVCEKCKKKIVNFVIKNQEKENVK